MAEMCLIFFLKIEYSTFTKDILKIQMKSAENWDRTFYKLYRKDEWKTRYKN